MRSVPSMSLFKPFHQEPPSEPPADRPRKQPVKIFGAIQVKQSKPRSSREPSTSRPGVTAGIQIQRSRKCLSLMRHIEKTEGKRVLPIPGPNADRCLERFGPAERSWQVIPVLLQVFQEKILDSRLVIGSELTVSKLFVEPKFSSGVFGQCLLQRTGVGKRDHCVGRRMD